MTLHSQEEDVVAKKPSKFYLLRASKWFIGATVFGASFTDGFLYSMVVPVLPYSLVQRSGVHPGDVQFWNSTLLIAFGGAMFVSCALLSWSTRFSYPRRAPLFIGLVVDIAAIVFFMLVSNTALLLVSRCLQGLASGLLFSAGLALIAETVPYEEAGSWIGFALSGADLGILISPLLAGFIYEKLGYHLVFVMGIILIAVEFVLVTLMVVEERPAEVNQSVPNPGDEELHVEAQARQPNGFDAGAKQSSTAAGSQANGHTQSAGRSLTTSSESADVDESMPLLGSHKKPHSKTTQGGFSIGLQLLRAPRVATAVYGCFVAVTLLSAFDATLPIFVHETYHWQSGLAGLTFLAMSLPSILAPAVGALSDRYGHRLVALCGLVFTILSLALMSFTTQNTVISKVLFWALLVATGMGYNMFLIPLASDLCTCVETMQGQFPESTSLSAIYLQAYALQGYSFALGTIIGPLIGGALLDTSNWAVECGVMAVVVVTATLPVFRYTKDALTAE